MEDCERAAFPRAYSQEKGDGCTYLYHAQRGMTMLDWFAGQALVGLLAFSPEGSRQMAPETAAKVAFDFAAAMLAQSKEANK